MANTNGAKLTKADAGKSVKSTKVGTGKNTKAKKATKKAKPKK